MTVLWWTSIGLAHSGPFVLLMDRKWQASLGKPHLLIQSIQLQWDGLCPTPEMLIGLKTHLFDCSDWFRSGHVSKLDPTSQNIETNIGTVERKAYPLFCWIWAKRIQIYSHSRCYLKMKTTWRATDLRDGERPGPWTKSSKVQSSTYFWIFQLQEPINSFLLYWVFLLLLLIASKCKFYEDRKVDCFVLCHMPCT